MSPNGRARPAVPLPFPRGIHPITTRDYPTPVRPTQCSGGYPLWIAEGFAHRFVAQSKTAEFLFKITDDYASAHVLCILWNDATFDTQWPAGIEPIRSAKDTHGKPFNDAEVLV